MQELPAGLNALIAAWPVGNSCRLASGQNLRAGSSQSTGFYHFLSCLHQFLCYNFSVRPWGTFIRRSLSFLLIASDDSSGSVGRTLLFLFLDPS